MLVCLCIFIKHSYFELSNSVVETNPLFDQSLVIYLSLWFVEWLVQVRSKEEDFLDLSIEVEQNTSITHCLQAFSNTETLCSECKYYCEVCCSKQEAQKRY